MTPVTVTVPLVLVSEANAHAHWRQRQRRAASQHAVILAALHATGRRFIAPPCVVVLTRAAPRRLDDDNAVSACKHARDAVAKWLGVDDRDPAVSWHVQQTKARTGSEALLLVIRDRLPIDDEFDRARERVLREAAP